MQTLLMLYSILLIILFTVVATLASVYYSRKKNPFFTTIVVFFATCILDMIVIMLTEFDPSFSYLYDKTFMTIPSFKTIIFIISAICFTILYSSIKYQRIEKKLYIPIIFMILFYLFIPMYEGSTIRVYTFYVVYQIFTLWIGIQVYRHYKNSDVDTQNKSKIIRNLAIITILFSLAIALEDFVVIFFFDSYSPESLHIQNRCYSEDIYRIILSIYAIGYLTSKIQPHLLKFNYEFDEFNSLYVDNDIEETTVDIIETNDNKYDKKFDDFCDYYEFTSREKEILKLIFAYKSALEISSELFIAQGTVKTHMHKIYQKVNVTKRSQLITLYNCFSPKDTNNN